MIPAAHPTPPRTGHTRPGRRPGRAWVAALVALSPFLLSAADVRPSAYLERRWLVDDGLPHNLVNRVVQDQAGYLWIATGAGLARFDGREFQLLRPLATSNAATYNVRDLVLEGPESLLLLPAEGGVVRYRDGIFSRHPVSDAVTDQILVDLFAEPNGTLWLGTLNGTLLRWQAGRLETFGADDGVTRRGNRFSFALDREGTVWVAGGDFLGFYRHGHLQRLADFTDTSVIIAPTRSGGIWISTYERLLKWENGTLVTVVDRPDWPVARSSVHYLFEDRAHTLWIATRRHGLFRFAGGRITPVAGLTPQITAVTEDQEGNIWASTEGGGLVRLKPKGFSLLDRGSGLTEDVSLSACADAYGALWLANQNGGLVRYQDDKAEVIAISPVDDEFFALTVCPDREDHIWVGAAGGLFRVPATAPYTIERLAPALRAVRVLFCARSGDMWAGTSEGSLGFFHAGTYRELIAATDGSRDHVTAICDEPDGTVWVAFSNGALQRWHDNQLVAVPDSTGAVTGPRINALYLDRDNELWVATRKGLRLQRGPGRTFTTEDGLADNEIDDVIGDNAGLLWICSRTGFSRVAIAGLKARFGDHLAPVLVTKFGRDDGLVGMSSSNYGQPRVWKTADNRLWFTTHRGLVGLEPSRLAQSHPPPPVYIDSVRIDGQPVALAGTVQVPAGRHRVDFRLVALNFSAPEKVRMRHQLSGIDLEWIETASEHTATYARLPPGRYRMQAIACNQDGVWNNRGATVDILVAAAWWESPWFAAAAVLAFTGVVVWSVRFWSHRRLKHRLALLEYENALERERARIARDLHDELGGSLTKIRLLAERLKRHATQPEFKKFASQLVWHTRRIAGELESIIWTVSPKNNNTDRLAGFISQCAMKFFRDSGITCRIEGCDDVPRLRLRPDEQHCLLAVAKEAMNNVLKHSQATQVTVSLAVAEGRFTLCVADNGVGFDPAAGMLAACNGLNNMRARLREIGGDFQLASAPGQGTTVTATHHLGTTRATGRRPSPTATAPTLPA